MIELTNIKKYFMMGENKLEVIRGLDFVIEQGEFVIIMGRSGSGKTTLLNILGCLDIPSEGDYRLFNKSVSSMSDNELSRVRNRTIGFIFQNFNLISRNSAKENIEKPLFYQGISSRERAARSQSVLQRVGLIDRLHHLPSQMSGGQQQRVAIARALITNPQLIIADEPTGNLDWSTGQDILKLLRQICDEGKTVIMVTHDTTLVQHSDRIIELSDGLIVSD